MSLVDSSAWIELFRASGGPVHLALRDQVASGAELATTEPVAMELLAGARDAGERRRIRGALAACRLLSVRNAEDWQDAAAIYASCRQAGATPRRLLGCLIASVAIREQVSVLARDRDFEAIAEHTALQLSRAE